MNTTDNLSNQRNLWLVQAALFIRRRLSAVHSALMRTFVTGLIVFLLCSQHCAAQKIGNINTDSVLVRMPEYHGVMDSIQRYRNCVQHTMYGMDIEYTRKTKELDSLVKVSESTSPPAFVHYPEEEYIEKRLAFEVAAEEAIDAIEDTLLQPLLAQIDAAILKVAKVRGYSYVYDLADTTLLYVDPAHDLFIPVCKELKLTVPIDAHVKIVPANKTVPIKIGHVHVDSVIKLMPGYSFILDTLTQYGRHVQDSMITMEDNFIAKSNELDSLKAGGSFCFNLAELHRRENELSRLQQEYFAFAQRTESAAQHLQDSLTAELRTKVHAAIQSVAVTGGYVYVMDSSLSSCLYADPANDLFLPVCKQLGIVLPQSQPSPK